MKKKINRKVTRLIALSVLLVIVFNIVSSSFNVVFATFSNKVTFTVNNTEWGYLTNLEKYSKADGKANTGDIKGVSYSGKEESSNGFHTAVADVVLDNKGRDNGFELGKSVIAKPEDEQKYEVAAWTVERDTTSNAYGYLGTQGIKFKNAGEIIPYIKEVCVIKAWFKPKEGAEGVRTIKYKAENGTIKDGSGYLNLVKGANNVNGVYTAEGQDKEALKCDWMIYKGEDHKDYIKGATAIPNESSYLFKGWYVEGDDSKEIISKSLKFVPTEEDLPEGIGDVTFVALFETEGQAIINYSASNGGKVVDPDTGKEKKKEVVFEENVTGAKAVPNSGYYFAGWKDEKGKIVSTTATIIPKGNLYKENATYTAVFGKVENDTTAQVLYLTNNEKWGALGKIEETSENDKTGTYKVFVNEIAEAYNGSIKGVFYDENGEDGKMYTSSSDKYEVDHLELNGVPFALTGNQPVHVKKLVTNKLEDNQRAAIGITDGSTDTAPVVIKVYFKPKNTDSNQTIMYKAKTEGGADVSNPGILLTNSTDFVSGSEGLLGCIAQSDSKNQFLRWELEDGTLVTTDSTITPEKAKEYEGKTIYAIYRTAYTIEYSVSDSGNGTIKTVDGKNNKKSETGFEKDVTGALAVPNSGYYFVGWTDKDGNLVSTSDILIPTGGLYKDKAEYKAVFAKISNGGDSHKTAKVLYLTNNEKWGALGKIESANENENNKETYEVFVNEIAEAYSGTIKGVFYKEDNDNDKKYTNEQGKYVVDHLELNGVTLLAEEGKAPGIHMKKFVNNTYTDGEKESLGITSVSTSPAVIKAYFRPNVDSYQRITYEVEVKSKDKDYNPGLLLTNSTDFICDEDYYLQGSTAVSTSKYKFVRWELKDENRIVSTNPTLTPDDVKEFGGKTLVAIYKSPNSGTVTYNINLLHVTKDNAKDLVRWKRKTDDGNYEVIKNIDEYFESELSQTSIGIAKYTYNREYYQDQDKITVANIIPEVDGYMFVGWFDKKRENGNGSEQPATIRPAGNSDAVYTDSKGEGKEYTLDAVWLKINVDDVVYNYTGKKEHTIVEIKEENGYNFEPDLEVFNRLNDLNKANNDYVTQIQGIKNPEFTVNYKDEEGTPDSGDYNLNEPPKFKDVGVYTVYYKIKSTYLGEDLEMTGEAKVTVNKINAIISANDTEVTYGDNFEKNNLLTANTEGAVNEEQLQYTLSTTADLDSNKNDAGDYPITINLTENSEINKNYNIQINNGNFKVNPRAVTLKVKPENNKRKYGEDNPTYTVEKDNVLSGDEDKITYTLEDLPDKYASVGSYNVVITADENQVLTSNGQNYNYKVSTENGTLTIEKGDRLPLTATGYEEIYDKESHTITIDGLIEGQDVVEYSLDNETWSTDVDTVKFTNVEQTKDPVTVYARVTNRNMNQEEQVVSNTVKILPKPVTVKADDKVAKYNAEIPKLTATEDGLFEGDKIKYSLSTDAKKGSNSGTYDIVVEGEEQQGNYTVTYLPGKLTIDPNAREDIKVTPYKGKYDAKQHTISVSNTIDGDDIEYSIDGENWSKEIPQFKDVTSGRKIVYVKVTNQNAVPSEINKTSYVTITPLDVKITAESTTINYGDEIPELKAKVVGTINDEKVEYKLSTPAYKGADADTYPINVIADENQGNYIVTVVDAKLIIKPLDREIVVKDYNGMYDGEEHSITVEGILPGDKVEYSLDNKNWLDEPPKFSDVTPETTVYVRVTNKNTNPKVVNGSGIVKITERKVELVKPKDKNNGKSGSPVTGDKVILYIIEFIIAVTILSTIEKRKAKLSKSKYKKTRNYKRKH